MVSRGRRCAIAGLFGTLLIAASVITVLRDTGPNLHADGVMQSIMSLQGVELFFWGQNRFLSVVPFLTSPITDPDANLFACLLLNALGFHGLLLLLAWMGAPAVTGRRTWPDVLLLFLTLTATAHLVIEPYQIYTAALDSQPYSLSWLLMLGGFVLWKRPPGRAWGVAAAAAGLAAGLNQSVVVGAAFLGLVEAVRGRQWRRWALFGAVWVGWLVVWFVLAARFGRTDAVAAGMATSYYGFDPGRFVDGFGESIRAVLGAFSTGPLIAGTVAAGLSLAFLDRVRRMALLRRFGVLATFCAGYLVLFAGNPWIAANGYPARYFFPVLVGVVVSLAAPIAAGLAVAARRWAGRAAGGPAGRIGPVTVAALGAGALAAAALAGPLTVPARSWIFQDVRPAAEFAAATDVSFVAGNYWVVWPLADRMLAAGRPALAANYKAGGDPSRYLRRLDELLATGATPRALCLNDSAESCAAELDRWTRSGWRVGPDADCPVAEPPPYADSAERACRVLEFAG